MAYTRRDVTRAAPAASGLCAALSLSLSLLACARPVAPVAPSTLLAPVASTPATTALPPAPAPLTTTDAPAPAPPPPPPTEPAPPVATADALPPPPPPIVDDGLAGAGYVRGFDVPGYVAFTFDDGPHPTETARVLAALAAYDVHATFFVVARQVWGLDHPRRRAELVAIADAGHDIGSHTWSHLRLPRVTPAERAREIDWSTAVVSWVIGRPVTMLRPPYGDTSGPVHADLARRGLTEVGWSIDPRDWDATTPAELRRTVGAALARAGGGVIVLHDDKWITATALPDILADLEAANCRRLATGKPLLLPVSLHYFTGRPVPAWVEARTAAYRDGLAARCRDSAGGGAPEAVVDNHTAAH